MLRGSPANWPVYSSVINALSVRGDLYSLNALTAGLEADSSSKDNRQPYETAMTLALCYASMAPWVESEGYLSLNKVPDTLIEKAREYARVRRRTEGWGTLARMSRRPFFEEERPGDAPFFRGSGAGDLAEREEARRLYASVARMDTDPARQALGLTGRATPPWLKRIIHRPARFTRAPCRIPPA